MSLWNTAQALGLKCRVVPIMPGSRYYYDDEGPSHRFASNFHQFIGGGPYDEEEAWGQNVPENKVTWLNDNGDASAEAKRFREVQLAYMTVGLQAITNLRFTFCDLILTFF